MPLINLEQGSLEWLSYRQGKVMATDASILMETNHWKTPLELWEEKLGMRSPVVLNDAMKRGQQLEPEAREVAIKETGIHFEPCVFESDRYPFMAASLDGFSSCEQHILEIKCPGEKTHQDIIDGLVPLYYIDQVQHQLFVTGASGCFFFSYRPEFKEKPFAFVVFEPNVQRQKDIIEKSQEFYLQLCTMQPPTTWKFKERNHKHEQRKFAYN